MFQEGFALQSYERILFNLGDVVRNSLTFSGSAVAGLTTVLTVRLPEPQFEGQTKEILGTPAVRQIVTQVVRKELTARFASPKRDDKAQTSLLLDKVVAEMKARISARAHKETQRRKNALESSSLPAKLVDCRSSDVAQSELFIVEGDSALGTAKLARNSEYQALLPDPRQDPERAEGVGQRHAEQRRVRLDHPGDRRRLGPHVRPERGPVRQGHPDERRRRRRRAHPHAAAHAVLPLHAAADRRRTRVRGRTAAASCDRDEPRHEAERDDLHLQRERAPRRCSRSSRSRDAAGRSRCSGTRDSARWTPISSPTTTMDRSGRLLRRVRLQDAEAAGCVFELLMGNDVAPRREFIVESSDRLSREAIDA